MEPVDWTKIWNFAGHSLLYATFRKITKLSWYEIIRISEIGRFTVTRRSGVRQSTLEITYASALFVSTMDSFTRVDCILDVIIWFKVNSSIHS